MSLQAFARLANKRHGATVAAIGFRAATSFKGNTTSYVVTIPASTQGGDLMVLATSWSIGGQIVTDPTGWALFSVGQVEDEGQVASRCWSKAAAGTAGSTSTEASTTLTLTFSATAKGEMFLVVYSGGGGIRTVQASVEGSTAVASHVTPAFTSDIDGGWPFQIVFDKVAGAVGTTVWTVPGGQSVRAQEYNTGTAPPTGVFTDANAAVANGGTVGGLTFTSDGPATTRAIMYTGLIEPGTSGPVNTNKGKFIAGMYNANAVPPNLPDGQNAGGGSAGGGDIAVNFRNIVDTYMPTIAAKMFFRRTFFSNVPTTDTSGNAAQGNKSAVSVKTNIATASTGASNSAFTTLGNAYPAGTIFILYHEPEDDAFDGVFTPEQWTAAQVQFADTIHATNAAHRVVTSQLGYLWGYPTVGGKSSITSNPARWVVPGGHLDARCCDMYLMEFRTGGTSLFAEPGNQRWHDWMTGVLAGIPTGNPDGVPLGLTEMGVVRKYETNTGSGWTYTFPYSDAQMAAVFTNTINTCLAAGYRLFWPWNAWHADFSGAGTAASPWHFRDDNFTLTTSETTNQPGTLTLQAWINAVSQFGSSSQDIRDTI